jgi:hypothetical protein
VVSADSPGRRALSVGEERWIEHHPWFASLRSDPAYAGHRDRRARRKADALLQ